jgi:hypothetical protein
MSAQLISDALSIVALKAIESKIGGLVNTFAHKLNHKHGIEDKAIIALWNETIKDIQIKYKKEKEDEESKDAKNTCQHVPEKGKNKGKECDKACKGDFCSAHKPEKLEKERQKREAKKTKKSESDEEPKKSSKDDKRKNLAKKAAESDEEEKPKKKAAQKKKAPKKAADSSDDESSQVSDSD